MPSYPNACNFIKKETLAHSVNLRIQSEKGKMWTRKNSLFGHFSRSVYLKVFYFFRLIEVLQKSLCKSDYVEMAL